MTIESTADLAGMQAVGRLVGRARERMRSATRAGITTQELDDIGADFLRRHGARSAPRFAYGFPGFNLISVNEEIVHGVPGPRVLRGIGREIEREVARRGFSVVRELSGHGVGRTIHESPEVPNYDSVRATATLTDGLVLAVEPILSLEPARVVEEPDGWTLRTHNRVLAVHYEHTVMIRRGMPLVLTAA